MSYSASDLRHNIVIFARVDGGKDKRGARQIAYVPWVRTMASIKDVSGREFYEAAARQLENVVTFTVRWRDGLRNDMRIGFGGAFEDGDTRYMGGTIYEIIQINHLGYRRDFVQLRARVVQAEESEGGAHGSF